MISMNYNEKLIEDIGVDIVKANEQNFEMIISELSNLNQKSIFGLTERETFILRKRYGFYDQGKLQTHASIAALENVTATTIINNRKRALRIIRRVLINYSNSVELNSSITLLELPSGLQKGISKTFLNRRRIRYFNHLENVLIDENEYAKKVATRKEYIAKSTNPVNANEVTIGDLIEWITGPHHIYNPRGTLLRERSRILDLATIINKLEKLGFDVLNDDYLKSINIGDDFTAASIGNDFSIIQGKLIHLEDLLQEKKDLDAVGKDLDDEITELYGLVYGKSNNGTRKQ